MELFCFCWGELQIWQPYGLPKSRANLLQQEARVWCSILQTANPQALVRAKAVSRLRLATAVQDLVGGRVAVGVYPAACIQLPAWGRGRHSARGRRMRCWARKVPVFRKVDGSPILGINQPMKYCLVAALNDRTKLSAHDLFPEWRSQSPMALDTL